jgi:hypothetical protein
MFGRPGLDWDLTYMCRPLVLVTRLSEARARAAQDATAAEASRREELARRLRQEEEAVAERKAALEQLTVCVEDSAAVSLPLPLPLPLCVSSSLSVAAKPILPAHIARYITRAESESERVACNPSKVCACSGAEAAAASAWVWLVRRGSQPSSSAHGRPRRS